MGLVAHNKRFLYAAVGAPGSTHDARLLRHTSLFKDIVSSDAIDLYPRTCQDCQGLISQNFPIT